MPRPPREFYPHPTVPGQPTAGKARQLRHATRAPLDSGPYMGDTRTASDSFLDRPEIRKRFTAVAAMYVVQCTIGPNAGDHGTFDTQLRPEPFVLQRITWATAGDMGLPADEETFPFWGWSQTGRSVEITWGDSFTKFLGKNSALLSALFGDSNGYLDLPDVALFQGSQNLEVTLNRLFWPMALGPLDEDRVNNPRNVRIDINFHGVGLLPKGVNQSGSL